MRIAIYPGSFDPIHKGHMMVIEKASKLFDKVFVVVSQNNEKTDASDINERFNVVSSKVKNDNVEVMINKDELSVNIAKQVGAKWIIRSGRDNMDFKYEIELAAANKHLDESIETIMIIPDLSDVDYKSRLIKQGVK